MTDEELVNRHINGDAFAFEEIVSKYEKLVYSICYRMFNNSEDAKDVSQEVFLKIYKNMEKAIGKGSFKAWICRIANNACIDELRKRKNKKTLSLDAPVNDDEKLRREVVDTAPLPEEELVNKEKEKLIKNCIDELPPDYKSIIVLRDINNLSYDEISEILNINIGTVKSRISRSRKKLKEIYLKEMEQYSK